MLPRTALFLDRDGTLIEEVGYLSDPDQIQLIPGAADVVRHANEIGVPVVVVTNQAGVARGLFTEARVGEVHRHLTALLAEHGATVDAYYYCPHYLKGTIEEYRIECECRKPSPGMLLRAARDLSLTLDGSWMVGDRLSDLEAGAAAGCRTILVRTGYGSQVIELPPVETIRLAGVFADLPAAAELIFPR